MFAHNLIKWIYIASTDGRTDSAGVNRKTHEPAGGKLPRQDTHTHTQTTHALCIRHGTNEIQSFFIRLTVAMPFRSFRTRTFSVILCWQQKTT